MSAGTEQRKLTAIIPLCGTDMVGFSALAKHIEVIIQCPVPQGRQKITQRFIAGLAGQKSKVPQARKNAARAVRQARSILSPLRGVFMLGSLPSVETLSYSLSPSELEAPSWLECSLARVLTLALFALMSVMSHAEPIRLHPDNPHYFLFRGKPTVLITSTEHYGAMLNPDFDFITYLDTLKAAGLNLTRTVNGNFLEATNATLWRGGDQNPLAPRHGRYLAPWKRSEQ